MRELFPYIVGAISIVSNVINIISHTKGKRRSNPSDGKRRFS